MSTWAATPSCSRKQAEQDVLGADVVVVQVAGLFHRVFDDLLGPRRLRQLAHRDHVRPALDELLDFEADLPQIDVEILEHVGGDAAAFFDQAQQHMLGADVFVVEALRLLVGELHHFPGPVGKSFVHVSLRCKQLADAAEAVICQYALIVCVESNRGSARGRDCFSTDNRPLGQQRFRSKNDRDNERLTPAQNELRAGLPVTHDLLADWTPNRRPAPTAEPEKV